MNNKKSAFTLAEVLITLGIIGVVAALTMPALIQNHQKSVYIAGLKKVYSTLGQGVNLAMVNDGVSDFKETQLYSLLDNGASIDDVTNEVGKYFQIIKSCKGTCDGMPEYRHLDGTTEVSGPDVWGNVDGGLYTFFLKDGSIIALDKASSYYMDSANGLIDIVVDVNGIKRPNLYGRDLFRFAIDENSRVVPWDDSGTGHCYKDGSDGDPCVTNGSGWCCSQRIMAEGWKMNY